jgi:hypothetical protein
LAAQVEVEITLKVDADMWYIQQCNKFWFIPR